MVRSRATSSSGWNSMEILGIPEDVCESEEAVLKIAQVLNVDVKAEDIHICHRVKRNLS